MYLELRGGVKSACSKGFDYLKRSILTWLNSRTVEQLNSSIFVKFFNISTIKLKNLFTIHYSQFTKKVFAFTLAETLIVMGVIGVVAALTLPNLNSSTNNKEKVAKLQKIYQNLEDALGRATAIYGPIEEWNDTSKIDSKLALRLSEFLKITKSCTGAGGNACFINPQGDSFPIFNQYILADGSSINVYGTSKFSMASNSAPGDAPERNVYGYIFVDLDGAQKGKNHGGYDIFNFYVTNQGIVPAGGENSSEIFNPTTIPSNVYDANATAWVLKSGNMDYLKNKNGKCPNGSTVLSWTQLSCN